MVFGFVNQQVFDNTIQKLLWKGYHFWNIAVCGKRFLIFAFFCRNTGHAHCISQIIICMFVFPFDLCSILSSHLAPNPVECQHGSFSDSQTYILYVHKGRQISTNMQQFSLGIHDFGGDRKIFLISCSPRRVLTINGVIAPSTWP